MEKKQIIGIGVLAVLLLGAAIVTAVWQSNTGSAVSDVSDTKSCGCGSCNGDCQGNCGAEGCSCGDSAAKSCGCGSCSGDCGGKCGAASCGCGK
jgi:hypothetical protein